MKKLFALFLVCASFSFVACGDVDGDKFRTIEISSSTGALLNNRYCEYLYGEPYHNIFTASEPILLTDIIYHEGTPSEEFDRISIPQKEYENPPFEVEWEGFRLKMHDIQTFEIWIDADCRPTTEAQSSFTLDLSPPRFWYDHEEGIIWWADDPIIIRNPPEEE